MVGSLTQVHDLVSEVVHDACGKALLAAGFRPDNWDVMYVDEEDDNMNATLESTAQEVPLNSTDVEIIDYMTTQHEQDDDGEPATYTLQANKRKHCKRLTRWSGETCGACSLSFI